jgi:hypothetical protein
VSEQTGGIIKNPPDLLRRVYDIFDSYIYITSFSPESKYGDDDDVMKLNT